MPLKDIRTYFFIEGSPVHSVTAHLHPVSKGYLLESNKTWIKKEMLNPQVAKIELLAQEFFRLIVPYQPETRLLYDSVTGVHYIFSENISGFRELPRYESHRFINGYYRGLGFALLVALFLQEIDLKNGNIGLDSQGRVIKIDGEQCFAQIQWEGGKYGLTLKTISYLPYPCGFIANHWLDIIHAGRICSRSAIVRDTLINAELFRREVNQAMLRICLLPDNFIEYFVGAYMPEGGERFIHLIKQRKKELMKSAQKNRSFQIYLTTPNAEKEVRYLIAHMHAFVAQGETNVVPVPMRKPITEEVIKQFKALSGVEIVIPAKKNRETIISENNALLDEIFSHRVNDKDKMITDYVENMRLKLESRRSDRRLLKIQRELTGVLESLNYPQLQAIKEEIQSLRNSIRWWTIGIEQKIARIEEALIKTPLEERGDAITARGPANKIQEALASHRCLGYSGYVYTKGKGEIDTVAAAYTYRKLQQRFFQTSPSLKEDKVVKVDACALK